MGNRVCSVKFFNLHSWIWNLQISAEADAIYCSFSKTFMSKFHTFSVNTISLGRGLSQRKLDGRAFFFSNRVFIFPLEKKDSVINFDPFHIDICPAQSVFCFVLLLQMLEHQDEVLNTCLCNALSKHWCCVVLKNAIIPKGNNEKGLDTDFDWIVHISDYPND